MQHPLVPEKPAQTQNAPIAPSPRVPDAKSPTSQEQTIILIVDDDETIRALIADMLSRETFTLVFGSGGREAVDIFRIQPDRFSLVVMDLAMPGFNGDEALDEMQKIRPEVKVIVMSGSGTKVIDQRLEGKKVAGFLHKPFRKADLLRAIKTAASDARASEKTPPGTAPSPVPPTSEASLKEQWGNLP